MNDHGLTTPARLAAPNASDTDIVIPLTLCEQLDAMLLGWLERHADRRTAGRADTRGAAVVTVAKGAVAEIERFCALWDMTAEHTAPPEGRWAVLRVDGPVLPVMGFAAITDMYRPRSASMTKEVQ